MRTTPVLALAVTAALLASGCSPNALKALTAAADAAANADKPTNTAKTDTDTKTDTPTKPDEPQPDTANPTGGNAKQPPKASAEQEAFFGTFMGKVDAAGGDPEKMARLFFVAFAWWERDSKFSKELMSLTCYNGEVSEDQSSRSGLKLNERGYWLGVDRQPTLPYVYFPSKDKAMEPNAEDFVLVDNEIGSEHGILPGGKEAVYFVKFGIETDRMPRPIRLRIEDKGEAKGQWRINNYSSIVVPM